VVDVGKKKILFVELNKDGTVGGSHYCLLELVKNINTANYLPVVLFYEENSLLREFSEIADADIFQIEKPLVLNSDVNSRVIKMVIKLVQKAVNYYRLVMSPTIKCALYLRKNKIDLIHLNNTTEIQSTWLVASAILKIPCVCHQRGYLTNPAKKVTDGYSHVFAISKQIKNQLIENNSKIKDKISVIYDGIDTRQFPDSVTRSSQQTRDDIEVVPDTFLITMVGNIKRWKGQAVVLNALKILKESESQFMCLFVGGVSDNKDDMIYKRELIDFVDKNNLAQCVKFSGVRKDVADIMNASDLILHASITPEPLGRVIFEAMALGKVVIATKHGGPVEIIDDQINGFLVQPNSPESIAAQVRQIMSDNELAQRIGDEARRHVKNKFDINRTVGQIESVYETLL
jgi:glycosyltransferase involved in cell wall biosynthesis